MARNRKLCAVHLICVYSIFVDTEVLEVPWRLQLIVPGAKKFITGSEVVSLVAMKLVYNDLMPTETVLWKLPEDCWIDEEPVLELKRGEAVLVCANPGWHTFAASVDGVSKGSRDVMIHNSFNKYYWKAALVDVRAMKFGHKQSPGKHYHGEHVHLVWSFNHLLEKGHYHQITAKLKLWIVVPSSVTYEELEGNDLDPKSFSAILTRQYSSLGLTPNVTILRDLYIDMFNISVESTGQLTEGSYWQFNVSFPDHIHIGAYIHPTSVPLFDNFVGASVVTLSAPKFHVVPAPQSQQSAVFQGKHTVIVQDACMSTVFLVLNRAGLFITEDSFTSMKPLPLPTGNYLKAATISYDTIHCVVDDVLYSLNRTHKIWTSMGLHAIGIKARVFCSSTPTQYVDNSMVLAWTDDYLHVVTIDWRRKLTLPEKELRDTGIDITKNKAFIKDAAMDLVSSTLALSVSVEDDKKKLKLVLLYNLNRDEWTVPKVWLEGGEDMVNVQFFHSVTSGFVFWDRYNIYYYYEKGAKTGVYSFLGCKTGDAIQVLASPDDYIIQVLLNWKNELVIITHKRLMYYGNIKHKEIVQILSGESSQVILSDVVLYFDMMGELHLVKINGSNIVSKSWFPLHQEVANSLGKDVVCPYIDFQHNLYYKNYYVDMGEQVDVWAMLAYPPSYPNELEVVSAFKDTSIMFYFITNIDESWNESRQHVSDLYLFSDSKNETFRFGLFQDFSHAQDYEQEKTHHSGTMRIEIHPSYTNLACPAASVFSSISIGCPPNRYLSVRKKPSDVNCEPFYNYTIPAGWYMDENDEVGDVDKVFPYPFELLGCPIVIQSTDLFLPKLDLIDTLTPTRQVMENFVVWEEHKRTGWEYTATMKDAGCQCEAQSREKMRQSSGETDQYRVLGPHNYEGCFKVKKNMGDLKQPYEILNATGVSSLKFTKQVNGIYIFNVLIIDPNFSFCSMHTSVAVRVINAFGRPNLVIIGLILFAFIAVVLTILAVTYMYFKRSMMKEFRAKALLRVVMAYQQNEVANTYDYANESDDEAAGPRDQGLHFHPDLTVHEGDFISQVRDRMHPIKEDLQ